MKYSWGLLLGGVVPMYIYLHLVDLYQCISPRGPADVVKSPGLHSSKQTASSPLKIGLLSQNDPQWNFQGDVRAAMFTTQNGIVCLQNDVFSPSELCPKKWISTDPKGFGTIQTGWARETQVHPTSSNINWINVLKMINHQITTTWLD